MNLASGTSGTLWSFQPSAYIGKKRISRSKQLFSGSAPLHRSWEPGGRISPRGAANRHHAAPRERSTTPRSSRRRTWMKFGGWSVFGVSTKISVNNSTRSVCSCIHKTEIRFRFVINGSMKSFLNLCSRTFGSFRSLALGTIDAKFGN